MIFSYFYHLIAGGNSSIETNEKELKLVEEPVFIEDTRHCNSCMKDLPISSFKVRRRKKRAIRRTKCIQCCEGQKAFEEHKRKLQLNEDDF